MTHRRRCGGTATLPPPTPPGLPSTGGSHDTTHARPNTLYRPARRRAWLDRPTAGMGAPPTRAGPAHVPRRPRPHRARPGRGARRGRRTARGDPGRGRRDGDRQPAGSRRDRGDRADDPSALRRRGHPARRAVAAHPERQPADHARPRRRHLAAPAPAGQVGARGRQPQGLPLHPRRGRVHRDRHSQARGVGHRERRQRVRRRLLRQTRVPRPEPAVLQAGAGRGVRARVRGRAGVPRRAARHGPAPGAVHAASTSSSASSRTTAR